MKLQLPKTVLIGSHKFEVTYDSEQNGGCFSFSDFSIAVGIENIKNNPEGVFMSLLSWVENGFFYA